MPGDPDIAPGGILALDIATVTGFAYAPPEAVAAWPDLGMLGDAAFAQPPLDTIVFGSQRFGAPGCDPGLVQHEAHFWLTAQLGGKKPRLIAIESPLPFAGIRRFNPTTNKWEAAISGDVQRKIGGLYGTLDLVRFRADVPWREYAVGSIRAHFCGDGRASKKPGEERIVKRCLDRGWNVGRDHNAADALAVLDYAVAQDRVAARERKRAGAAIEAARALVVAGPEPYPICE